MGETQKDNFEALARRVTELEELSTHQERTVQQLNEVILQQERRLTETEAALKRVAEKVDTFSTSGDTPRSLEDERPPHY
ncbi:MAG TPA: SlyX family protein [Thermoguttaceae bacterium]|nr:SlyX family protein [Thermoguttaceae bacterium]